MNKLSITTDNTLRSTFFYGTKDFPVSFYYDDFKHYKSQCIEWHWHTEFEFSVIVEGKIDCCIGTDTISLSAGDGIFINSGTIHRFTSSDDAKMVNILFLPELIISKESINYQEYIMPFYHTSTTHILLNQKNPKDYTILEHIKKTYLAMCTQSEFRTFDVQMTVAALWRNFLEHYYSEIKQAPAKQKNVLQLRLQQMLTFIETKYHTTIVLEDIASAAKISKTEALRCFQKLMNTTPVRYLNEYRLIQAIKLLQTTDKSITEIAFSVGYESSGYFCKVFKKQYNLTPKEYRDNFNIIEKVHPPKVDNSTLI